MLTEEIMGKVRCQGVSGDGAVKWPYMDGVKGT